MDEWLISLKVWIKKHRWERLSLAPHTAGGLVPAASTAHPQSPPKVSSACNMLLSQPVTPGSQNTLRVGNKATESLLWQSVILTTQTSHFTDKEIQPERR